MRKSDLHRLLQSACVPILEHSGCFAVIPPAAPALIDVPSCYELSADSETVPQGNPDAHQTLAYVRAFALGTEAVVQDGKKAVTVSLLLKMHTELMSGQDRINPGKFREVQNFIGSR